MTGKKNVWLLELWLRDVDRRGVMLGYLLALLRKFKDIHQLASALLPKHIPASCIDAVEAAVYIALEMDKLGHQLLFARGIIALGAESVKNVIARLTQPK